MANLISIFFVLTSLILIIFKGLNFGIDFKGGTLIELRVESNNIKIEKNDTQTLENSFKKAFEKFSQRVLLEKDSRIVSKINSNQIKNLISHYQIVNKKENNKDSELSAEA